MVSTDSEPVCGAMGTTPLPPTEARLDASRQLDSMTTLQRLQLLNEQDAVAVTAVGAILPDLAEVVDIAVERFRHGGVIHYFGAGTSGRLGVLDAVELLPTFNLGPDRVIAHIAGGQRALTEAVEDAEDSVADGAAEAHGVGPNDIAIGFAASGNTPYVGAALARARQNGAYTVLISSNPYAVFAAQVDKNIVVETGPEVLTGSTRLKAGTAEKLILNAFSTSLMVAVGRTWSNLMVSVVATNAKLRERLVRILCDAAAIDADTARAHLEAADGDLKTAIVCALTHLDPAAARALLADHDGVVAAAVATATT